MPAATADCAISGAAPRSRSDPGAEVGAGPGGDVVEQFLAAAADLRGLPRYAGQWTGDIAGIGHLGGDCRRSTRAHAARPVR